MIGTDEIEARIGGRSVGDESCFWTRAARGYRDGLARMGTNAKMSELESFCDRLLQRDPRDRGACWARIGFDVRCCSNELDEHCWRTLLDLGDFRPHWLVEHAFWVAVVSGKDTVPLVSATLRRHQLVEITRPQLHELASADPPYSERWVARVIALTQ